MMVKEMQLYLRKISMTLMEIWQIKVLVLEIMMLFLVKLDPKFQYFIEPSFVAPILPNS